MDIVLVDQGGQRSGYSDSVVGAEGGSVGSDPFAVDDGCDGGVLEIEAFMVRLADHVHVALEDNALGVLIAGGCGNAHQHVADGVGLILDAVLLGEVGEVLADFALLFEGRGTFVISSKISKTCLG